jgi:hypothetical protein
MENIINLINYANEWRNLKTKCILHNYSLYSNRLNPSSGFEGVARKRNSAPILPWNNRAHSNANEAEYEKVVLVKFVVNHQKYLPWKYWNDHPSNHWAISRIPSINNYWHYYANELINIQIRCMLHNYNICSIIPEKISKSAWSLRRSCMETNFCPNFTLKQWIVCKWGN